MTRRQRGSGTAAVRVSTGRTGEAKEQDTEAHTGGAEGAAGLGAGECRKGPGIEQGHQSVTFRPGEGRRPNNITWQSVRGLGRMRWGGQPGKRKPAARQNKIQFLVLQLQGEALHACTSAAGAQAGRPRVVLWCCRLQDVASGGLARRLEDLPRTQRLRQAALRLLACSRIARRDCKSTLGQQGGEHFQ